MATKNLYYAATFQRTNHFKELLLSFFMSLASAPRMLIEVFIRKDFGERYFRLYFAIGLAVFLGFWPLIKGELVFFMHMGAVSWTDYITWYVYLAAFLYFSFRHHRDQKRNPSVFDFARFSLSSGNINPVFRKFEVPWRKTDVRFIEIWIEPAAFFVSGFLLFVIGQALGLLLMVCAVIYGMSYAYAYHWGDNFVMDKIDEMIVNEEMKKSFVDDAPEDQTRGFNHRGKKPTDPRKRERLLIPMTGQVEKLMAE